ATLRRHGGYGTQNIAPATPLADRLLAVPTSEAERDFAAEYGADALEGRCTSIGQTVVCAGRELISCLDRQTRQPTTHRPSRQTVDPPRPQSEPARHHHLVPAHQPTERARRCPQLSGVSRTCRTRTGGGARAGKRSSR